MPPIYRREDGRPARRAGSANEKGGTLRSPPSLFFYMGIDREDQKPMTIVPLKVRGAPTYENGIEFEAVFDVKPAT